MQARLPRAFTIIELMVVVTTIGILALLSLPGIRQATDRTRATATANDLRILVDSIEFYSTAQGTYPSAMSYNSLLNEIKAYLPATWQNGSYNWFYSSDSNYTYVSVYNLNFTAEQSVQIDRIIDDGNIATGNLRISPNHTGLLYLFTGN
jgi:prepilin-type N-terminal cleavage/methylation domain-containing protein